MWRLLQWILSWFITPPPLRIPYENLFPLGMEKGCLVETPENVRLQRVQEVTPDGPVDLEHDGENNIFLYWSPSPISYKHLEVVARKYVILFDKKHVYVNMFRELLEVWDPVQTQPRLRGPFVAYKDVVPDQVHGVKRRINRYRHVGRYRTLAVAPPHVALDLSFKDFIKNTEKKIV